ncbi:MAG: hypothetical protein H6573_32890 [Lewinellaceae bacterium]|nr:hypothetical protein [Lewinellaceae bacterium]
MEQAALNKLLTYLPPEVREAVRAVFTVQQQAIAQRDEVIESLEQRIRELEAQLNQNSRNSSRYRRAAISEEALAPAKAARKAGSLADSLVPQGQHIENGAERGGKDRKPLPCGMFRLWRWYIQAAKLGL